VSGGRRRQVWQHRSFPANQDFGAKKGANPLPNDRFVRKMMTDRSHTAHLRNRTKLTIELINQFGGTPNAKRQSRL